MTKLRHILSLSLLLFISILFITSCSDPEPQILFKYSVTLRNGEKVTNVTNAEGKNVLSYAMKTSFTSTYMYNKFNTYQVEGIKGEDYVTIETGEEILVDTYSKLDAYGKPLLKRLSTKEGKVLGAYFTTSLNGQIYATEKFATPLPIRFYSFNGEEIKLEKSPNSPNVVQNGKSTLFPHSGGFNFIFTKGLDTLLVLPSKMIDDSSGARVIGFTSIKLDRINDILPYIKNLDTKELTIYDKIPSFAVNDFLLLSQGDVIL